MKVKGWEAKMEMLVDDGTGSGTVRQSFAFGGGEVELDKMPEYLARILKRTIATITDSAKKDKMIANLEAQIADISGKLQLMEEANVAFQQAKKAPAPLPEEPAPEPIPVATAPSTPNRRRRS